MHKRKLIVLGTALFGAAVLSPSMASHVMAAQNTSVATAEMVSHNTNASLLPQDEAQYHDGYMIGKWDGKNGCYKRDLSTAPVDFQRGWLAGFTDAHC
jgi:hypothetical protein